MKEFKEILLFEVEFQVGFEGSYQIVSFNAYDPNSTIDGVVCRRDWTQEGQSIDLPCLLIRDRGNPGEDPTCPRYAVVVRRMGRATPVPQEAGAFVGRFVTENGRWEWYVFGPRKGASVDPAESVSQKVPVPKRVPPQLGPSTGEPNGMDPVQSRESPLARAAFGLEE